MEVEKRTHGLSPDQVQHGNRRWWTQNTMDYDWHGELGHERYSAAWYDAIDARFIQASRLFATDEKPFDRIIPFERLHGARVLEIGCGMGLHTELMTRAGARVTAIDLSPTSVMSTTRRLALKGLSAKVIEADAEELAFDANSFDFVWSWGVIHHSARTGRIVRQIARVLTPQGEVRVMVYNRNGMSARVTLFRDYLLKARFLRQSYEESLYRTSDGFSARFYVKDQFEDLFRAFFADVDSMVCGQESDAMPLPRQLRPLALRVVPEAFLREAQQKRGSFLFLTASRRL